jgi:hypothetical protein
MRRWLGAWAVGVMVAWGCGGTDPTPPVPQDERQPERNEGPDGGAPDGGHGGHPGDGGTPDGGSETAEAERGVGPWPDEPLLDYSRRYGLGRVRAVGVDDGYNLWLLDGERIGVLRPGDEAPRWTTGVGQAAGGFGPDRLATGSTVICGGGAGRAYVGYSTYELENPFIFDRVGDSFPRYDDPDPSRFDPVRYREYLKGDLDVVRLEPDGQVVLEERLHRSARPNGPRIHGKHGDLGIRNTNDHHFDEDRSVLSCVKVMRGRHKGDLYIGTNHGVTRIQGLVYNSHRHPVWFRPRPDGGRTQMAGYTYALGIAWDGDVLIGNDWTLGIVTPSERLEDWDRMDESLNPMKVASAHLPERSALEDKDFWRGFQQTTDGRYYLASLVGGLWELHLRTPHEVRGTPLAGLPTDTLTALAATEDGSLFIGTRGFGLWRLDAHKRLSHVPGVEGPAVEQLLYDPTVKPAMLYVLTHAGLTVLRGH